ncbi:hypothetical protein BAUCODRAFT_297459 [Baudoinia panamericana UAMH 10762]|uniref:Uncharacterized protein n=1 Tax=Baudoinia panamericana (strain UAMH 10762) TaxID=717646 RepID=M2MY34_BAUPA|nr:uncharacterized protein BAUCODRAFT_297459 [Baudoinia panamericana UAMH 10762]EMC91559.1 hypothetical protein BAUCODRAFT_297459 [Baudoinia panamericana UAMH 10762]
MSGDSARRGGRVGVVEALGVNPRNAAAMVYSHYSIACGVNCAASELGASFSFILACLVRSFTFTGSGGVTGSGEPAAAKLSGKTLSCRLSNSTSIIASDMTARRAYFTHLNEHFERYSLNDSAQIINQAGGLMTLASPLHLRRSTDNHSTTSPEGGPTVIDRDDAVTERMHQILASLVEITQDSHPHLSNQYTIDTFMLLLQTYDREPDHPPSYAALFPTRKRKADEHDLNPSTSVKSKRIRHSRSQTAAKRLLVVLRIPPTLEQLHHRWQRTQNRFQTERALLPPSRYEFFATLLHRIHHEIACKLANSGASGYTRQELDVRLKNLDVFLDWAVLHGIELGYDYDWMWTEPRMPAVSPSEEHGLPSSAEEAPLPSSNEHGLPPFAEMELSPTDENDPPSTAEAHLSPSGKADGPSTADADLSDSSWEEMEFELVEISGGIALCVACLFALAYLLASRCTPWAE